MKRNYSCLAVFIFFAFLVCCFAFALPAQAKDILIVHSYDLDNICGAPQQQGVLESLAEAGFKAGKNLTVHQYAMNTKKENNTPELMAKQAAAVLEKIKKITPDVLVLLDDNAFRTVGLKLVDSKFNIVFSGMNGQPEDYDRKVKWMDSWSKPGHNITGVYEKLHFIEACMVQKKIIPGLEKILVVTDNSPTGRAVLKQVRKEMNEAGNELGIEFQIRIASTWEEYVEIIRQTGTDSSIGTIYPAATLLKDRDGKSHSTSEIIKWTVANSMIPGIPLNYSFSRLGMLGGVGVDFIAMGRQAGVMAAEILKGSAPGEIPIEEAERYALVFNLNRAKELGMDIPTDILMAADVIYK
ncbi:ABC transporter substrate binding protein [Maridesulfovibrio sp.]|uniref:ABC transporter substrate-binding protein n=1 Tax=Maridesulfovibrio sp. TaxID=2795000 RepID=UPI002AA8AF38|nr:ABC transporter substrate binding protein [Maridesulfovibrio sp.]